MIINETLVQCLNPLYKYKCKDLRNLTEILTYNDYICLENALINHDAKIVYSYLQKILGYKFYNKPNTIKRLRLLKGLSKTMQNIEKTFYKATKPTPIEANELGCGFEEIAEKWRHSLRIDAVAKKTGLDVFTTAEKSINEIYSWYALAKAEQSAEAIYSKKLEDNVKR